MIRWTQTGLAEASCGYHGANPAVTSLLDAAIRGDRAPFAGARYQVVEAAWDALQECRTRCCPWHARAFDDACHVLTSELSRLVRDAS